MEARGRDQGAQAAQEGVRGHVGERGASARGRLEVDADAAVRERLDGIVGEGGAEQVATQTLEALAVAAVDGGSGVQVESEG